jgi:hypothetical protein
MSFGIDGAKEVFSGNVPAQNGNNFLHLSINCVLFAAMGILSHFDCSTI